ncbi:hypothetical protein H8356DRAFT_1438197 [Neocallimastix lanati (nom. inval.)]|nr:hypothetical protein H8356DRAFT_1438197 [Neocallimastix sp. JGI-2020a]
MVYVTYFQIIIINQFLKNLFLHMNPVLIQSSAGFEPAQGRAYLISESNSLTTRVFSDSNKLTLFITKVFGYRPGNNSSTFNVSTHEGAGTFQALANKELTSPKANWASGL